MKSKSDLEAYAIMYVVKNKKDDVIAVLLKNGVVLPSNSEDIKIGLAVTEMLKKSKSFKNDFIKLIQREDVVNGITSNMSGNYSNASGFIYDPIDFDDSIFKTTPSISPITNSSSISTASSITKTSPKSSIEKFLLLGQGLFSDYTSMREAEAKAKLAQSAVDLEKAQASSGANKKDSSSSSTKLYVFLGLIGLGMLGFLTYKLSKK